MLSRTALTRLLTLISFMEQLPPEKAARFNMDTWFAHRDPTHRHRLGNFITPAALKHCGTTACALGWAAIVPSFRKAGLKVEVNEGGWCNINVARAFFDLGPDDSNYLFGFGEIGKEMRKVRTPKGWAKRARQFIIDEMTPAPTAQ